MHESNMVVCVCQREQIEIGKKGGRGVRTCVCLVCDYYRVYSRGGNEGVLEEGGGMTGEQREGRECARGVRTCRE